MDKLLDGLPTYTVLMAKHNIRSIQGGSDLKLNPSTGSIEMNRFGDIAWKGKAHDGVFQFVNDYIRIWVSLALSFENINQSFFTQAVLVEKKSKLTAEYIEKSMAGLDGGGQWLDDVNMQIGSAEHSRQVSAGSIFVQANKLIAKFELNLETSTKLGACGPFWEKQGFGTIIRAASNNARHADEWRAAHIAGNNFLPTQKKSLTILAKLFSYSEAEYGYLSKDMCAETLALICNNQMEEFEAHLFSFVNEMAQHVDNDK